MLYLQVHGYGLGLLTSDDCVESWKEVIQSLHVTYVQQTVRDILRQPCHSTGADRIFLRVHILSAPLGWQGCL